MPSNAIDINDLDYGIADAVVLLNQGGFCTFTSCHGGRGHAFQQETIGIELEGSYSTFQKRLVRFLRSHGMENFTIDLVTHFPSGNRHIYLSGVDLLSGEKKEKVMATIRRKERKLWRRMEELGIDVPGQ